MWLQTLALPSAEAIAYTYSEPIAWFEYTLDTAKLARAAGVRNILVTSGYIRPDPLRELAQYIDARSRGPQRF